MDKLPVVAICQNINHAAMRVPAFIHSPCSVRSCRSSSVDVVAGLWWLGIPTSAPLVELRVAPTSSKQRIGNYTLEILACLAIAMDSDSTTSSTSLDRKETPADQSSTKPSSYHPTLWKNDFIESLKGDYKESMDEEKIANLIEEVRNMFRTMGDGATTASAYDTAWVARVPALDGSGAPQFLLTVQWVVDNQLKDGSWGETALFLVYDRVINTLACVLALKTWNLGEENIERGLAFIAKHIEAMKNEAGAHMLCGFELCFISMMEEAKLMGLKLPYHASFIETIAEARDKKSSQGLQTLVDWNRILNLQSKDGSFLSSPASTACVLMHTGNQKCIEFLNSILPRFNSAVPCHYPLDLFERLWAVDGLMRLGIDRFFQKEIRKR